MYEVVTPNPQQQSGLHAASEVQPPNKAIEATITIAIEILKYCGGYFLGETAVTNIS